MRSRVTRRSTPPQTCTVPIPNASGIPVPCGDRRFRAGRCVEHWTDWKQARESGRGTSRVNPARREMRTLMRELGLAGGRQKKLLRKWIRFQQRAGGAR